ncbi:U-box domain-containing protein 10 [Hibiscus syriacus]|uniref:RING-type E3 ubiquitin transferase n=1 Tax=Hibiscus syriacus TaxID=106335 RepID=A0A6A2YAL3_HIBSY|nr:U-box domain-containing protein 11-like [Hibiscus syriacus]KAE8667734.1 U-box domain-containing protein 10 [Hibiscus syriacus]
MAGGAAFPQDGGASPVFLLRLVLEIVSANAADGTHAAHSLFNKDCTDLVRRIALFTHLLEEIRDSCGSSDNYHASASSSSASSWSADLAVALHAAKRLVSVASAFNSDNSSDGVAKRLSFQFQCVTWKLEKALGKIPYDQYQISEEVQEQVSLVRAQLRRATERYGSLNLREVSNALSQRLEKHCGCTNSEISANLDSVSENRGMMSKRCDADPKIKILEREKSSLTYSEVSLLDEIDLNGLDTVANKFPKETKKPDALVIPEDFLCPISLELMRDPVIVSTGQTYERSYIQRWIDCGNSTCPKTQQKLTKLTLTPNYVLRSLITQWCATHNIEQPSGLTNGRLKKSDGSLHDVSGDMAAIQALVCKLSSRCFKERRAAVAELRSLSKRSTDNRILIADAGAIPVLVNHLTTDDVSLQENAVTSILNLSIYENNKSLIMLAGAVPSIVQVLRAGSMEARENAAATLFSLSFVDENKIIIGASGAIPALVDLLQKGSARGKKDAATALFNLCIYQGNKGRAVRAGIVTALLKMLTDSGNCMVDEALTILSVLASNHDAKAAIINASTIPVLIDLLRTGLPRTKENASAVLLVLCKRDTESLSCLSRLGAAIPLTELTKSGTERAKRKASTLLEHLCRLQQQ